MHDVAPPSTDRRALRARRIAAPLLLLVLVGVGLSVDVGAPTPGGPPLVLDELRFTADLAPAATIVDAPEVDSIDALRRRIAEVLEREGVPGVGLALVDRDGVRWAGGVGVMDRESGRPVDGDTYFRVASITKSVVALGVMRLVEAGRLDLDRPLAAWMPEIAVGNPWEAEAPITLAHALEHTAGFDDMRFNEWYGGEATVPRDALARNPRSRDARWRPGSRMSYSNPGYTLAGHAIERATGERYDQYLEREVLAPLGMSGARFHRTPEIQARLATGYLAPDRAAEFQPIAHAPAGALLASPRELGALVHFWLTRGEGRPPIVGPAGLDRIERSGTLDYQGTDTNYGLGNYGDVLHPARARGHDGGLPGFLSSYRYFPELGVGYVMLLNSTHSTRAYLEVRALLFAYLTRDRDRPLPTPPSAPVDPEAVAAAVGYYGLENPRNQLFAFLQRATTGIEVTPSEDGVALASLTGRGPITLVPTADGGYRHPREGGTSVRLTRDREGERILVAGMAYFEDHSQLYARARLLALQAALVLLQLAPLWGLGWALRAGIGRLRGRRLAAGELALHGGSIAAGVLFVGMVTLFNAIFVHEAFTDANPLSIGFCAVSLAFAAGSALALAEAIRAHVAGSIPWTTRLLPSATAIAAFGMTIYLMIHGIIGLRIWAW
ncbi:MAG: serine hydrolase domain-containing protein [Nannocystaceae bacterium]